MVESRDYEYGGKLFREVHFDKKDLVFSVEAYQYAIDENIETDFMPEFMGDTFEGNFERMVDAIKKCIELIDEGWEVVRLIVRSRGNNNFYFICSLTSTTCYGGITIDLTDVNKTLSEKLAKIKQIVEEVKP